LVITVDAAVVVAEEAGRDSETGAGGDIGIGFGIGLVLGNDKDSGTDEGTRGSVGGGAVFTSTGEGGFNASCSFTSETVLCETATINDIEISSMMLV
jgi:hypothetical protein